MKTDLKDRARRLKVDIPAVFLALKKKETPILAKICGTLTVLYALSPIDLIPDFIPILGYLDDIILLPALIALTIHFIPEKEIDECRKEAEGLWENGKPKKWYYGLPILFIWLVLITWIIKGLAV